MRVGFLRQVAGINATRRIIPNRHDPTGRTLRSRMAKKALIFSAILFAAACSWRSLPCVCAFKTIVRLALHLPYGGFFVCLSKHSHPLPNANQSAQRKLAKMKRAIHVSSKREGGFVSLNIALKKRPNGRYACRSKNPEVAQIHRKIPSSRVRIATPSLFSNKKH